MAPTSGVRDMSHFYAHLDLTELYWDVILVLEASFLATPPRDAKEYKRFQKIIVDRVGKQLAHYSKGAKLRDIYPAAQSTIVSSASLWRQVGRSYTVLYNPSLFNMPLWCKTTNIHFHVVINQDIQDVKQLLLSLLEYADMVSVQFLRIYLMREFQGIKELLHNLNWLGGYMVKNEDRTKYFEQLSPEELEFSDEKFVIVEFEC